MIREDAEGPTVYLNYNWTLEKRPYILNKYMNGKSN